MRHNNIFARVFNDFFEFIFHILYMVCVAPFVYVFEGTISLLDISDLDEKTRSKAVALGIIFGGVVIAVVTLLLF